MSRLRLAAACVLACANLSGPRLSAQFVPGGPMRIVVLLDSSSAVSGMVPEVRASLHALFDALPGDPEIALITTGGQLRVRVPPTRDRDKLHAAASRFSADGGGNAFLDTMIEADKRFFKSSPASRPVFVIVTTDNGATVATVRVDMYRLFREDFTARGGRAHGIVIQSVNAGLTTQIVENLVENTTGFYETIGIANALPRLMPTLASYVGADQ